MTLHVIASGSAGNCYTIDDGKSELMLDCGVPIGDIKKAMMFDFTRIKACLLTHSHADHSKAAADLCKAGIDVYMSMGTAMEIGTKSHRIKIISPEGPLLNIGGCWDICPFVVKHDTAEPFGYWIRSVSTKERLIYLTDSAYAPYIFSGLDYILVECNHDYESLDSNAATGVITPGHRLRVMQNHFSLENCIYFIGATMKHTGKLKKIVLLHASKNNANAKKMIREIQAATGVVTEMAVAGGAIVL